MRIDATKPPVRQAFVARGKRLICKLLAVLSMIGSGSTRSRSRGFQWLTYFRLPPLPPQCHSHQLFVVIVP